MSEILGTAIVLIILAIMVFFAIRNLKNTKCDGNCASCGSGCSTGKNKNIDNAVAGKKVVSIEGMHCEHCKTSIEKAINALGGTACIVHLDEGNAEIFMSREISDDTIKKSIEELGFTVTNIVDVYRR